MSDGLFFMTAFAVIVTVVMAPLVGLAMLISYSACQSQLSLGGLKGTWGPLVDCQVQMTDGNYIPYDRWRGFEHIELKRAPAK